MASAANKFRINVLLDVYGALLTKRQQEILELYYREDLSYFEISEELDISRAAVSDTVHKAVKQLEKFEEVVGFVKKREKIVELCQKIDDDTFRSDILEILNMEE